MNFKHKPQNQPGQRKMPWNVIKCEPPEANANNEADNLKVDDGERQEADGSSSMV